mgnify:FL=1
MDRKKIIRWASAAILIALVAFTVISNQVYQDSLPRVRTQMVEQEIGSLLDGYGLWETLAWVPKECIFPASNENMVCVYRIEQRAGQFTSTEYFAQAVESPVLDEREDAVLLEALYLDFYETLICETNLPVRDGQTVVWLNEGE